MHLRCSCQNDDADDIVLVQVKYPCFFDTGTSQVAPDLNDFGFRVGPEDYSVGPAIECLDLNEMGRQGAPGSDKKQSIIIF